VLCGGALLRPAEISFPVPGQDRRHSVVHAVAVLHNHSINHRIPAAVDPNVVTRNAAIQPAAVPAGQHGQASPVDAVDLRRQIVQQF